MARYTLSDAKASRIPAVLNIAPTDSRFVEILNECTNALLTRMKPWETTGKFVFNVESGCIVWPRQIATIEAVWVCDRPIVVRNEWFETLESGFGLQGDCDSNTGQMQLYDRGTTCVFSDMIGLDKKVRVYTDVAEVAGARILVQGSDENSNWIRTLDSGTYVDGEYIALTGTPTLSTKLFSVVTGIQKPVTKGFVRLYEYDTILLTQRAIAVYEPDETRPNYRKSFLTGIENIVANSDGTRTVTVMAKLDFIPVRNDTDFLIIGNLTALKYMCQSLLKAERNLFEESMAWEVKAVNELMMECRHRNGDGAVTPMRFQSPEIWGAGGINIVN